MIHPALAVMLHIALNVMWHKVFHGLTINATMIALLALFKVIMVLTVQHAHHIVFNVFLLQQIAVYVH
mgnify:CR=1 FL=1